MYPSLPYPGYSWSMNHHMGVATKRNLQALVWAAERFRQSDDPAYDINNYFIANNVFTSNIRADTGQPEGWRDYQQIASELGLIFSTKKQRNITPTPLGTAFIEEIVSFEEVVTLQALRYQYPNGHRTTISPALRKQLAETKYPGIRSLTELQAITGVRIRPAILVWKVLRELQLRGERDVLNLREVQLFLLPCIKHEDTLLAVNAIITSRQTKTNLNIPFRANRDIQEWFSFLLATPLFDGNKSRNYQIKISNFGISCAGEVDVICQNLENAETFWMPDAQEESSNISWYEEFGSIDLSINLIPRQESEMQGNNFDIEDDERQLLGNTIQVINLRPFNPANLFPEQQPQNTFEKQNTTSISYDANFSIEQHTLHDKMIVIIANVCHQNGGQVFDDPQSVDLLVGFENHEFMIEVKSVTPRNFAKRLRLALGQLLHYDYLRSLNSQVPRRKVVALTAYVPSNSWCIPFLNSYLDFDLLTLGKRGLRVNSSFDLTRRLFTITNTQTSLFDNLS